MRGASALQYTAYVIRSWYVQSHYVPDNKLVNVSYSLGFMQEINHIENLTWRVQYSC